MISPKYQRLRASAKTALQAISDWIRRHWMFLVMLLSGAVTAALVIRRKTNVVSTYEDAIAVQRAKAKIRELSKQQSAIEAKDAAKADEVFKINGAIVEQHKIIAETTTGKPWETLSEAELFKALKEAGL